MSIKLFTGPMYCGKTRSLINEGEKHERAGRTVVYLKSALDARYGRNTLTISHDGHERESHAVRGDLGKLPSDVLRACLEADVVCIDEGQFLEGLARFCEEMATRGGKRVLVAALDGDFQRKPFEGVAELMPLCDKYVKMKSVCVECGRKAPFTRKIAGSSQDRVDVGGAEKYVPTCRKHHAVEAVRSGSVQRMRQINERLKK